MNIQKSKIDGATEYFTLGISIEDNKVMSILILGGEPKSETIQEAEFKLDFNNQEYFIRNGHRHYLSDFYQFV